jgi:hypothetical protein
MFPRTVQYRPSSLLVHSLSSRLVHPALTCTFSVIPPCPSRPHLPCCPLIAAPSRSMHAVSLRRLPLPRAHRVPSFSLPLPVLTHTSYFQPAHQHTDTPSHLRFADAVFRPMRCVSTTDNLTLVSTHSARHAMKFRVRCKLAGWLNCPPATSISLYSCLRPSTTQFDIPLYRRLPTLAPAHRRRSTAPREHSAPVPDSRQPLHPIIKGLSTQEPSPLCGAE